MNPDAVRTYQRWYEQCAFKTDNRAKGRPMTDPYQHNCPHHDSGWCLDCVGSLRTKWKAVEAQLEAALAAPIGEEVEKAWHGATLGVNPPEHVYDFVCEFLERRRASMKEGT